jgi:hypothetical protein
MPTFEPEFAPPPYTDLAEANKEIRRLQKAVFQERLQLAGKRERFELTKRSLMGTIRKLEAELQALKGTK